jgi:hypothetical protein
MVSQYGQIKQQQTGVRQWTGTTESDQQWKYGLLSLTCQMHFAFMVVTSTLEIQAIQRFKTYGMLQHVKWLTCK